MRQIATSSSDSRHLDVKIEGVGTISFESSHPIDTSGQAALPAALPILMKLGDDGTFEQPLDPDALRMADDAQGIYAAWFPNLTHVEIVAEANELPHENQRGTACFFSGGVDSYYSALSRRSKGITHLIYVRGFDTEYNDVEFSRLIVDDLRSAAQSLGVPLVEVATNIRDISDKYVQWNEYHGAALATVAILLQSIAATVIIPSSYYINDLFPWGSHPALDPLWGGRSVNIQHHGSGQRRIDKVQAIAEHQVALQHLRVCWKNERGRPNCGRCEKCKRTMISLRIINRLENSDSLPNVIDTRLATVGRSSHSAAVFAQENLQAMRNHGVRDREIERYLKRTISRYKVWEAMRNAPGYRQAKRLYHIIKRRVRVLR